MPLPCRLAYSGADGDLEDLIFAEARGSESGDVAVRDLGGTLANLANDVASGVRVSN